MGTKEVRSSRGEDIYGQCELFNKVTVKKRAFSRNSPLFFAGNTSRGPTVNNKLAIKQNANTTQNTKLI